MLRQLAMSGVDNGCICVRCANTFKIKQMQLSEGTFLKEEHVFLKLSIGELANFNVVLGPILTSPTNEDETSRLDQSEALLIEV